MNSCYKNMAFKYIVLDIIKKAPYGSTRKSIARDLCKIGFEQGSVLNNKISNAVKSLKKDGRLTDYPWIAINI